VAAAPVEQRVEAVIFDWGGTLTPWHEVDLPEQWRVFAREVHGVALDDPNLPAEDLAEAERLAARILEAETAAWQRGRSEHSSATLAQVLDDAGVDPEHDRHHLALAAYHRFWEPHTHTDPQPIEPGKLLPRWIRAHAIDRTSTLCHQPGEDRSRGGDRRRILPPTRRCPRHSGS